ncbi:MAG: hypothetical protein ACRDZY_09985 [Acidimicrobiales bacterium]
MRRRGPLRSRPRPEPRQTGGGAVSADDAAEYACCLDWAGLHPRLAEAISAGAGLVATHRRLLADPEVRTSPYLDHETACRAGFFHNQQNTNRRTA